MVRQMQLSSHAQCRCAIHWDDAVLKHELMVRPAGVRNNDTWHWSGGFKLTDRCVVAVVVAQVF